MKQAGLFLKLLLIFTGINLLLNYFDFDGLYRDSKRTKRKVNRWF